jgi:hypothetical protein
MNRPVAVAQPGMLLNQDRRSCQARHPLEHGPRPRSQSRLFKKKRCAGPYRAPTSACSSRATSPA